MSLSTSTSSSASSSATTSRSASPTRLSGSPSLDISSYFNDIEGNPRSRKPKKSVPRQRAPAKKIIRPSLATRMSLSRPKSPSSEEDGEWEREAWEKLVNKQKHQEEAVRKAILARKAFNPTDLKKWLDSEDTCSLPEPTLGLRIRQDVDRQR